MKLTAANYYSREANIAYMSNSQFKQFMKCEAAAMAELRGEWVRPQSTAMLIGSYVDEYFTGNIEQFKDTHPEIFHHRTGELKADYKHANEIIERIERDKLFMEYLSGRHQVIFTRELWGAVWKIKTDSLHSDKIVDLKIIRSLERVMGRSFIEYWDYDQQGAVYTAVEGNGLPFYIAAATKEDIPDIELIHIPEWRLAECRETIAINMPHIMAVKTGKEEPVRCGVCDYCKATKMLKEPIDFSLVGFSQNDINMIMKGAV